MALDIRPSGPPAEIDAFVRVLENSPGIRIVRSSGTEPTGATPAFVGT
ncbi:hypothetical protein KGD82_16075 [Nocardiopsis eucommiae]|uniref:Uncharacterized protein n=1 Tax=Nocardiopsis eucommiae TaxID=2831970 RepID=A0A975L833_9ACTN|nr:hypothetical protein KGD82_16075 [Nocardiopsis eucommiae]